MKKHELTPRAREMRGVLRQWERSGLTQREFAARRGMPVSTLVWWRRVLGWKPDSGRRSPGPRGAKFVELKLASPAPLAAPLEVVLPGGALVRVPSGFDAAALRAVVAALEPRC